MPLSLRLSAGRRRAPLRLDALESRTVPAAAVGTNVAGSGANNFAPPDTDGAIGPTHYVQFINGFYRVHTKAGALVGSVISDNAFWNNAGIPVAVTNTGLSDPRILFDPLSDRWFAAEITTNNGGNLGNEVLIARSNTNNPLDGFKAARFVLSGSVFADYPTLGVDGHAVYVGTNNFDNGGDASVSIISYPKADLLLSTPSIANRTVRTINSPQSAGGSNAMGYTLQGVTNFNTGQTTTGSIVAVNYNAFSVIDRTRINGTAGSGATFGTTSHINVATTSFPGNSRQPNGQRNIDGNDDRIGTTIYQVGDLIFLTHGLSVNSSGNGATPSGSTTNAIRITVLRDSTGTVATEATFFNPNFDYVYPSLAVNRFGDIVVGYTRSSGALGSGATDGRLGAYAVHAKIDLNNPGAGITFGQELQLRVGAATNYSLFGGTERWGDYSATTLDPTNPTSFWTTQEYASGSSSWGTQISQIWVSPRVTGVTTTAAPGTYGFGQVIPIQVTFNDTVTVTGTPQIALNAGGGAVANYASGSGTKTLTFNYTVGNGQQALAPNFLDYSSTSALTLNGGTIRHASATTLDAELALPAPGSAASLKPSQIAVEASVPVVTGVNSPTANGTYGIGATVDVTVTFSRPVNVTGVPQLALNAGAGAVADYLGGTGSNTLTFRYTAAPGDFAADLDYASTSALTLPGGATITDTVSAAPATRTLPAPGGAGSLGANKNIAIDARLAQPTDITSPTPNGSYDFGDPIDITVTFSKPVTVAGVPELALNSNGTAVYTGGPGTFTSLTFTYTVGLGDFAADLDYDTTGALTLPGGATITDQASGLAAPLTLPAPGGTGSLGANKALAVDGRPAAANNVTSPTANGSYQFGAAISITVGFTRPVVVDTTGGTPTLALNFGGTAVYTGGPGTFTSLTFSYTVGLGDFTPDLDYAATTALALNGATIQDEASNTPAVLILPAPGAPGSLGANKALSIDGRPAQVVNVTSTLANGTYPTGTVIPIQVMFSKRVTVDTTLGVPTLALNSGPGGTAAYTGGTGTSVLTFTYTVVGGDMAPDLDYTSTSALALNGGAIQDEASNTPAPLTLPAPGAPGSLGSNKNLIVDTSGPTIEQFRVKFGTRWYDLLTSTRTNLPWKITAVQVVFDEPVFGGRAQSLQGLSGRAPTGVGTRTLTWRLTSPLVKGVFNTNLATSGPNMLRDAGGNPIVPAPLSFRVLYGDFTDDGVVNSQDEQGIRALTAAPYLAPGSAGYNLFADLSGDGLVNLVDVGIARSRKGQTLP